MAVSKWPRRGKYLHIEVYNVNVWLFTNPNDWDIAMDHLGLTGAKRGANQKGMEIYANRTRNDGEREYIFVIGVFDGDYGTLVHEASHAALDIFDHIGSHPASGNGEPFAYLNGLLFDKFHKFIKHKSTFSKKRKSI